MTMAFAMLAVSVLPTMPASAMAETHAEWCRQCHMRMSGMGMEAGIARDAHLRHAMPAAMRHCRIECCGHHDSLDGLPHPMAPHVAVWHGVSPLVAAVRARQPEFLRPLARALSLHSPPPKRV